MDSIEETLARLGFLGGGGGNVKDHRRHRPLTLGIVDVE